MIFEPYLSIDLAVQVEPLAVEARELQRHLCVGGYSWMDGPCGLSNKIPGGAQFRDPGWIRYVEYLMSTIKAAGVAGAKG